MLLFLDSTFILAHTVSQLDHWLPEAKHRLSVSRRCLLILKIRPDTVFPFWCTTISLSKLLFRGWRSSENALLVLPSTHVSSYGHYSFQLSAIRPNSRSLRIGLKAIASIVYRCNLSLSKLNGRWLSHLKSDGGGIALKPRFRHRPISPHTYLLGFTRVLEANSKLSRINLKRKSTMTK